MPSAPAVAGMSRSAAAVMAFGCAVSVANLYYIQPLLPAIAQELTLTSRQAGFLTTLTQVGYATGILLLVPLGDVFERRGLIVLMLLAVSAVLVAVSFAPNAVWLGLFCFLLGLTTITPQLIIPFAAHLAGEDRQGRTIGTVMSGLLIGILLARTLSGLLGGRFGWRVMFGVAAGLMLALAAVLRTMLPQSKPTAAQLVYAELLRSLGSLVREEPQLVRSSLLGAMSFAAFCAFWTVLPYFLSQAPYRYGTSVVGLFGLLGVLGIVVAPLTGRASDRGQGRQVVGLALSGMLGAYALLWRFGQALPGLIGGFLVLDIGATANHLANQAEVYRLRPEARSRLNTVYMTTYFAGGAAGSASGAYGWSIAGWPGLCSAAALFLVMGLLVHVLWPGRRGGGIPQEGGRNEQGTLPVE